MEILNTRKNTIIYYSYILLFIILFFYGLYHARSFLIPVSLAALFAMLLWPIAKFFEEKGVSRAGAAGLCVVILLLFLLAFIFFFASQAANLASQFSEMQGQLSNMLDQVKNFLSSQLGINTQNLFSGTGFGSDTGTGGAGAASGSEGSGSENSDTGLGSDFAISSYISNIVSGLKSLAVVTFKTIVGLIIITVYVFLMLLYRHIFINFIRKLAPKDQEAENVTRQVAGVSKDYLAGRLIVIGIVAVINSVGLTLIGIKQGIFFGVLAAVLDLIPYIGIIIGAGLPLIMSIVNHQSWWPFFAVLGLFFFVQLLENYFLTPKIVGSKVRLNPLFTLMAVLVGGYVWGVAGMILFIPFLGMIKVIFDHIEPLHPYAYLIEDPDKRTRKT